MISEDGQPPHTELTIIYSVGRRHLLDVWSSILLFNGGVEWEWANECPLEGREGEFASCFLINEY